jgi:hypothetical protein
VIKAYVFGDIDPEDAWDDGDLEDEKVIILLRVLEDLSAERDDRFEARRTDAIRLTFKLVHPDAIRIRGELEAL